MTPIEPPFIRKWIARHITPAWVFTIAGVAWAGMFIFLLSSCDTGARKDLSQDDQKLDTSEAVVIVNPDKFPNITHKCLDGTGFWTTTQGNVWIVYNDPLCPGHEGPAVILSNIAGRAPDAP